MGEGTPTTGVVLMLVRKMAASSPQVMRALLECGAAQELQRLQVDGVSRGVGLVPRSSAGLVRAPEGSCVHA